MLTRLLTAVLNAVVVFILLYILVIVLGLVGLAQIGAIITPFIILIAIIIGLLTFLGKVPNYWKEITK
jgi:hypothetical protein